MGGTDEKLVAGRERKWVELESSCGGQGKEVGGGWREELVGVGRGSG